MSIKQITMQVDLSVQVKPRSDITGKIARTYGAHVKGLFISPPTSSLFLAEKMAQERTWLAHCRSITDGARRSKAVMEKSLDALSVPNSWSELRRSNSQTFVRESMLSDLIVLGQSANLERHDFAADLTDDIILRSRRPCLVVPNDYVGGSTIDRIMIAWNNSHESARAVHDSLPFLKLAKQVYVVCIASSENERTNTTDLEEYLSGHGVNVSVFHKFGPDNVCRSLLDYASEKKYQLIVLGAYGHMRIRGLILGGVTGRMLRQARLLTLLSH